MKFYKFSIDEGSRIKYAIAIDTQFAHSTEDIHGEVCNRQWRRLVKPDNPSVVLTTNHYADFLVTVKTQSPKDTQVEFQRLLKESDRSLKIMPEDPPVYYMLKINKRLPLHKDSNLEIQTCDSCGFTMVSTPGKSIIVPDHPLFIKKEAWDGSDIFILEYAGRNSCSERFYDAYHENRLTGLVFTEFPSM